MAISKKIKGNISHAIKEINEIRKLHAGKNIKDLEIKSSTSLADKEYNTISYKLGKALIDSKKDMVSAISTPRKLIVIYLESKRRSKTKNIKYLENAEVIVRDAQKSIGIVDYKKIDDFIVLYIHNDRRRFTDFN